MPTSVLRRAAAASLQTATVQPSRERPRAGSSFRGDVLDGELCKLGGSGLKKVPMPASLSQDLGQIFAQTKRCKTLRDAGRDVRAGIANTIRMIHTALAKADASEFLSKMKQVNPAQFKAFFLGMKARTIAETHAEIDKIQSKVQTIDQRIEEARRLNLLIKAGQTASSDALDGELLRLGGSGGRAARPVEKYSTANAARLRVMLGELRTLKTFLSEASRRTDDTLDVAESMDEDHSPSASDTRRSQQVRADIATAQQYLVSVRPALSDAVKLREIDAQLATRNQPDSDEDFGDTLFREADNCEIALQALGKAHMQAMREILGNAVIVQAPSTFEADLKAAALTIDAEFVRQKVELHKSAVKLERARQVYREARRTQKAGQVVGSGHGVSSSAHRRVSSSDSHHEAMRSHEPRRARGDSTVSDDSARSVAAGAVDDSAKSNSDIAIETIGNFKRADAVTAKLLTDYQQKARTSALAAKIHRDLKRYKTTSAQWRLSALAEMKTASRSRLLEFLIDSRNDLKQAKSFRPN